MVLAFAGDSTMTSLPLPAPFDDTEAPFVVFDFEADDLVRADVVLGIRVLICAPASAPQVVVLHRD
jgi:hypothetical protein